MLKETSKASSSRFSKIENVLLNPTLKSADIHLTCSLTPWRSRQFVSKSLHAQKKFVKRAVLNALRKWTSDSLVVSLTKMGGAGKYRLRIRVLSATTAIKGRTDTTGRAIRD